MWSHSMEGFGRICYYREKWTVKVGRVKELEALGTQVLFKVHSVAPVV